MTYWKNTAKGPGDLGPTEDPVRPEDEPQPCPVCGEEPAQGSIYCSRGCQDEDYHDRD